MLALLVAACALLLGAAAGADPGSRMPGMAGMAGLPGTTGSTASAVGAAADGGTASSGTASSGTASSGTGESHPCDATCASAAGGLCLLVAGLVLVAVRAGPATLARVLRRVADPLRALPVAPPLGRPPWAVPDRLALSVDRR